MVQLSDAEIKKMNILQIISDIYDRVDLLEGSLKGCSYLEELKAIYSDINYYKYDLNNIAYKLQYLNDYMLSCNCNDNVNTVDSSFSSSFSDSSFTSSDSSNTNGFIDEYPGGLGVKLLYYDFDLHVGNTYFKLVIPLHNYLEYLPELSGSAFGTGNATFRVAGLQSVVSGGMIDLCFKNGVYDLKIDTIIQKDLWYTQLQSNREDYITFNGDIGNGDIITFKTNNIVPEFINNTFIDHILMYKIVGQD